MSNAKIIASKAHSGQKYGALDYIEHIEMVRHKVRELFGDGGEEDRILDDVAILHDVVEDSDLTFDDIREQIGFHTYELDRLIDALRAITKLESETRKDYIVRCVENPLARMVKIADTLSNLECSIRDGDQRRIFKYTNQIERIYAFSH